VERLDFLRGGPMSEPYCLAMILCDAIHIDSSTGKQTILGTFSTVGAHVFPATVSFGVYFAITDIEGKLDLIFRMVDSKHGFDDDSTPVFELPIEIMSPSPLAVVEGHSFVSNATLTEPGVYHCELLTGDNVLMARRLVAIKPPNALGE
jgi:hypothetical protein